MKPLRLMERAKWAINDGTLLLRVSRSLDSRDRMPKPKGAKHVDIIPDHEGWYIDVSGDSCRRRERERARSKSTNLKETSECHVAARKKDLPGVSSAELLAVSLVPGRQSRDGSKPEVVRCSDRSRLNSFPFNIWWEHLDVDSSCSLRSLPSSRCDGVCPTVLPSIQRCQPR